MHTNLGGDTLKRHFLVLTTLIFTVFLVGCSNDMSSVAGGTGYDTAKIGWGLKKVENSQPEVPESWKQMLKI